MTSQMLMTTTPRRRVTVSLWPSRAGSPSSNPSSRNSRLARATQAAGAWPFSRRGHEMSRLQELRQALGRAHDELIELTGDENAFTAKQHEISDLEGQIRRTNQAMQARAALGRPADPGAGAHNGNEASGERAKFA